MAGFSYILSGLLVLLTGLLLYWEYRLKYHSKDKDGRTADHKKRRRIVLWVALVLIALNQLNGFVKDYQAKQDQEKLTGQLLELNTNNAHLTQSFDRERQDLKSQISLLSTQLVSINSNQANLSIENQRLLSVLSTNSAVDPSTRAAIIEANRRFEVIDSEVVDLNAWMSELNGKRALSEIEREQSRKSTLEAEKPIIEKCAPIFDYAVKRIQAMIAELAKQKAETPTSTYIQIPTTLSSNAIKIAEISLGTNSVWRFDVTITKSFTVSDFSPPQLRIACTQGQASLQIRLRLNTEEIFTSLHIPNEEAITGKSSLKDYKKIVDTALRNLVAVRAEQLARTGK